MASVRGRPVAGQKQILKSSFGFPAILNRRRCHACAHMCTCMSMHMLRRMPTHMYMQQVSNRAPKCRAVILPGLECRCNDCKKKCSRSSTATPTRRRRAATRLPVCAPAMTPRSAARMGTTAELQRSVQRQCNLSATVGATTVQS